MIISIPDGPSRQTENRNVERASGNYGGCGGCSGGDISSVSDMHNRTTASAEHSNVSSIDFDAIQYAPALNEWFRLNLRCSQSTFYRFCALLRSISGINKPFISHSFEKRVTTTLYSLASSGGFCETAQVFGVSKSWSVTSSNAVIREISALSPRLITLPFTEASWDDMQDQFQQRAGLPHVCGTLDGTLFSVARPREHEAWYCRKGYPAVNMQAVVNAKMRFISYDIRPGSWSDKKLWNCSSFGRNMQSILQSGPYIIGDADYTLSCSLLTPL